MPTPSLPFPLRETEHQSLRLFVTLFTAPALPPGGRRVRPPHLRRRPVRAAPLGDPPLGLRAGRGGRRPRRSARSPTASSVPPLGSLSLVLWRTGSSCTRRPRTCRPPAAKSKSLLGLRFCDPVSVILIPLFLNPRKESYFANLYFFLRLVLTLL